MIQHKWIFIILWLAGGTTTLFAQSPPTPILDSRTGIQFVPVPAGSFQMGDIRGGGLFWEKPVHEVELDRFEISAYEITNHQYAAFLNEYGSDSVKDSKYSGQKLVEPHEWGLRKTEDGWIPQPGYEQYPVVMVTWYGAYEFCRFYGYQLPTEAQWEYAARSGGKRQQWAGTSDSLQLDQYAWFDKNSDGKTHPVGQKKPNALGLYDMSGNVWEWCLDSWDVHAFRTRADNAPVKNPVAAGKNANVHILRGGAYDNNVRWVRTAYRYGLNANLKYANFGFRVVR